MCQSSQGTHEDAKERGASSGPCLSPHMHPQLCCRGLGCPHGCGGSDQAALWGLAASCTETMTPRCQVGTESPAVHSSQVPQRQLSKTALMAGTAAHMRLSSSGGSGNGKNGASLSSLIPEKWQIPSGACCCLLSRVQARGNHPHLPKDTVLWYSMK